VDSNTTQNKSIICLAGPTASGKTDLALAIAKKIPCHLISVDSALVYRGMDIGTAKPSAEILAQFPHALINICDPAEPYSAAQFAKDALCEIEKGFKNNCTPLLVGGTMLYFKALLQGMSPLPSADPVIRQKLQQELSELGAHVLHEKLKKIDPVSAARIHPNDPQRLLRALEVHAITGKSLSSHWESSLPPCPYPATCLGLTVDRAMLHERIATRFDKMLEDGFLQEVQTLFQRNDLHENLPAIKSVGYRQAWAYLNGEMDFDTFKEKSIIATRQLAKRQRTWMRSWNELKLFDRGDVAMVEEVLKKLL
jgi:tRNA dimethylallyltransferase